MSWRTVIASTLGALGGGIIVWIGQSGSFRLAPANMSYPDLAATLLAAVGTIVAILGGFLALAAIWGFKTLKDDAVTAAGAAGVAHVKEQIENGAIRDYIKGEIERLADEEFKSERMDQRINRRVDAVTFGRPDDDKLLEEEGRDL